MVVSTRDELLANFETPLQIATVTNRLLPSTTLQEQRISHDWLDPPQWDLDSGRSVIRGNRLVWLEQALCHSRTESLACQILHHIQTTAAQDFR